MMNKLKIIIGVLAILSLLFGQCMCPHRDNTPVGALGGHKEYNNYYYYSNVELLDEWTTIDSKWHFKDGGELTIKSQSQVTNAYWIDGKNTLEIIVKGESTIYSVEVLSETKLKLTSNEKEIILEK